MLLIVRVLSAALLLLAWAPDEARGEGQRCLGRVCFAEQATVGNQPLSLKGIALFEYWSFDVYTGAFYAVASGSGASGTDAALAPVAKKLVLRYHRAIAKADFIKSTRALLRKNPTVNVDEINAECEQLFQIFQGVNADDRYSIDYTRERGTTLSLNDKPLGTIAGEKFQAALFGIWLSNYSVGATFTAGLLGGD